jgi:hypothetical protein
MLALPLRLEVIGSMSDAINLRKNIIAFTESERFDGYSKVIINVTDDLFYEAGDTTGRTLTLSCPWGTQDMANNLLAQMRGFSYQPYTAEGAILDPASELGDGINVNGVYSGIYRIDTKFNSQCAADISAPSDEEIDYEYQYKSKQQREVKRKNKYFATQLSIQQDKITAEVEERKSDIKTVKSTLEVQSSQIVAKVNKTEGSSSTFGWALETDSWRIFAGSSTVLKATKDGLEVKGKITATSGTIGGFTINSNSISYNSQTWGGTNTTGIYIGPNGIQLGNHFKVDSMGNLTAYSGTFEGAVSAQNIKYGGNSGYFSGAGISSGSISGGSSGKLAYSTLTNYNLIGGINTSLGYADFANGVFSGWNTAGYVSATYGYFSNIVMGGATYRPMTTRVMGPNGETPIYIYYLGRAW